MSDAYKILVQTQIASAAGILATVTALKSWTIANIRVINTDTSTHTFQLWINGTTDAFAFVGTAANPITLLAGETYEEDILVSLEAGVTIQGDADVASKLSILITGVETT